MITRKHSLDTIPHMQPCKRQNLDPEGRLKSSANDCFNSQLKCLSPSYSPAKRTRADGSISVCDKQPRLHEVLDNPSGEDVHSIYFEINQYLGELHFLRQVRELRLRQAASQLPPNQPTQNL